MNLQQGLVGGVNIQSAFAQQANSTVDAADEDAADEDAADEGAADEDAADEDAADEDAADEDAADEDAADEGAADEGAADEGAADEGAADEGAADEGAADDKNALPVANDKSVETDQDESVDIQLTGDDEDEDEVTFSLKTYPEHGELAGVDDSSGAVIADGNVVTYSPEEGFYGEDSFSVRPYDGERSGKIGYISISVHPESQDLGQRPIVVSVVISSQ